MIKCLDIRGVTMTKKRKRKYEEDEADMKLQSTGWKEYLEDEKEDKVWNKYLEEKKSG